MVSLGHKLTHLGNWQLSPALKEISTWACTWYALTKVLALAKYTTNTWAALFIWVAQYGRAGHFFRFCNLHYLHYLFIDSCNLLAHLHPCCIRANASILDHPLLAHDTQGNKLPTEYQYNIKHHGHILVQRLTQCKLRYQWLRHSTFQLLRYIWPPAF